MLRDVPYVNCLASRRRDGVVAAIRSWRMAEYRRDAFSQLAASHSYLSLPLGISPALIDDYSRHDYCREP